MLQTASFLASFVLVSISSKQIGELFSRIKLPLITGFLFTGMLAGPYVLGLISKDAVQGLRFVDHISLAVIAFAAGNELHLKELSHRFKSIVWVTVGQTVAVYGLGTVAVFFLADFIPFMRSMSASARVGVSLLVTAILVARSPSSAIAIVNEMRAKGPFTQTALGVTMVTDVTVIVLFSISFSVAKTLLSNRSFELFSLGLLLVELLTAVGLGYLIKKLLSLMFSLRFKGWGLHRYFKRFVILLLGYGVFMLTEFLHHYTHDHMTFIFHLEPLLICMVTGFFMTNYGKYRAEFTDKLHKIAPPIYIVFFTITGASLGLDVLLKVWPIALALFGVRLLMLFLGSWAGGTLAGDPPKHNRLSWMVYLTQAGVGLGLAKEVAASFPGWGGSFATLIIAVIVINQLTGPPFFKWAIQKIGEAHPRAETPEFDGHHDAVIFGLDGRTTALARQLLKHNWNVKIAAFAERNKNTEAIDEEDLDIIRLEDITVEEFRRLELKKADAVVTMLQDDDNLRICELVYEHFGTETMIALLHERENFEELHKLGAMVIFPDTALVSLFDHVVRSPLGTSFLLGLDEKQDVVDLEVRDPKLHGVELRDLVLPSDVLVLSVFHRGKKLVSHGYTQLELGDRLSVLGSPESLEKLELMFEEV